MKLAQALMERKDIQNRLDALRGRLCASALTQEGENPPENPAQLLAELNDLTKRHEELCYRINQTNSVTMVGGESLTALLARRDAWNERRSLLADMLNSAIQAPRRSTGREIKILPTINVSEMRTRLDEESRALRQLDALIQQANWNTDLQ